MAECKTKVLYRALLAEIKAGKYPPQGAFPSDHALERRFKVSIQMHGAPCKEDACGPRAAGHLSWQWDFCPAVRAGRRTLAWPAAVRMTGVKDEAIMTPMAPDMEN